MNFLMVDGAGTDDKPLKIPKEVWILVNHLYTKSCDQVRELQLVSGYANIFSPLGKSLDLHKFLQCLLSDAFLYCQLKLTLPLIDILDK